MKLYFVTNLDTCKILAHYGIRNILVSYYYLQKNKTTIRDIIKIFPYKVNIFLDCGAPTARSKGVKIDIKEYCSFLKITSNTINTTPFELVYPNLDVGDVDEILSNQKYMEQQNLHPIPVFYPDDMNWDVFEQMCKDYDYVAIGKINAVKDTDELITELNDLIGIAKPYKTKIHLFGVTSHQVLEEVPCYSADSTNWLGKYGKLSYFNPNLDEMETFHWEDQPLIWLKKEIEREGIDYNKIIDGDSQEIAKFNCINLLKFENYLTKKHQPYWAERYAEPTKKSGTE